MTGVSPEVSIFEVAPRDGLQHEPSVVPVDLRLQYIQRLVRAGLRDIEVGSFVQTRWVPQMAGTEELVQRLRQVPGVRFWTIVANLRQFERARAVGATHICLLTSASDQHTRKNLNRSRADALQDVQRLAALAGRHGINWRGYVSAAFGCVFQGGIDAGVVIEQAEQLLAWGAQAVAFADTAGLAQPQQVRDRVRRILDRLGSARLAFHFHDSCGQALTNAHVAFQEGIRAFDAAAGGIGGAIGTTPGRGGTVATEDLIQLMHGLGVFTGVELDGLVEAAQWLEDRAGVLAVSRYYRYAQAVHRGRSGL